MNKYAIAGIVVGTSIAAFVAYKSYAIMRSNKIVLNNFKNFSTEEIEMIYEHIDVDALIAIRTGLQRQNKKGCYARHIAVISDIISRKRQPEYSQDNEKPGM